MNTTTKQKQRGERELQLYSYPVNLPDIFNINVNGKSTLNKTEGRTRVKNIISSPVKSPRQLKPKTKKQQQNKKTSEGRTTTHTSHSLCAITIRPYYTLRTMSKNGHFHKM